MGNLGFIGGVSSDDIMNDLPGEEDVTELGRLAENPGFSKSLVYQNPNDVFLLVMQQAHFGAEDAKQRESDYLEIAGDLLRGASADEMIRFERTVLRAKEYVKKAFKAYESKGGNVQETMGDLHDQYAAILAEGSEHREEAIKLMDSTEVFFGEVSNGQSGLALQNLYNGVSAFSYAVECVVHRSTGLPVL